MGTSPSSNGTGGTSMIQNAQYSENYVKLALKMGV
jgi:hypothetical protein